MMEITEVRIDPVPSHQKPLCAYVTIIIDACFLVQDLKIIEGSNGLFVSMPSRRIMDRCQRCQHRNPLAAKYCNSCGTALAQRDLTADERAFIDIAHPVNTPCREYIHKIVVAAFAEYRKKADLSSNPPNAYRPKYR